MNKNPDIYIMDIFNSFVSTLQEWGSFLFGKISFFRCESNNPIPNFFVHCKHPQLQSSRDSGAISNTQSAAKPPPKMPPSCCKMSSFKITFFHILIDLLQTFRIELTYICLSLCLLCGPLLKKVDVPCFLCK